MSKPYHVVFDITTPGSKAHWEKDFQSAYSVRERITEVIKTHYTGPLAIEYGTINITVEKRKGTK